VIQIPVFTGMTISTDTPRQGLGEFFSIKRGTMFKKFTLFISVLFLVNATAFSQNSQGTLFIIGGGSRPASLINEMIDASDLKKGGYAIVLPMASSKPQENTASGVKQLVDNGVSAAVGFHFEKGETPSPSKLDSLKNATLIYITGGSQSRFMDVVEGTAIETAILACFNNGGTITGTSAGAAVMSEKMINGKQALYPDADGGFRVIEKGNTALANGLGLIKTAIIDQHFVKRSRHNRLMTLAMEYPELKCIGIDESTAIIVKGKKARVVGLSQVLVYDGSKGKTKTQGSKLGMEGIKLSVYLDGDTFSIK
jgi:cyanophycinase